MKYRLGILTVFHAYSKRKFHMDVKFILKKVAEKHLESMCK